MEDDISYASVLKSLKNPQSKRDHRAIRLAAVTSALSETAGDDAAKVYAQLITVLEGTLGQDRDVSESISTQCALLELLSVTVPHVSSAILDATLPLLSRVLRAVVETNKQVGNDVLMETNDGLGGATSVLRLSCRAATGLMKHLGVNAKEPVVRTLFIGTLLELFEDRRLKVRKDAQGGVLEIVMMKTSFAWSLSIRKLVTRIINSELIKVRRERQHEQLESIVHLIAFVEQAIAYLDYAKISSNLMELFAILALESQDSSVSNFVVSSKVKDSTPAVLVINGILSTITTLLRDETPERKEKLDQLAARVLANLLQANPALVFRRGRSDTDVLQRGKSMFGLAIIASCDRLFPSSPDVICKLYPLAAQAVVMLSRPTEDDPDDASIADELMPVFTQQLRTRLSSFIDLNPSGLETCTKETLKVITRTMDALYRSTWPSSLKSVVAMLQILSQKRALDTEVKTCLCLLLGLRNEVPPSSPSQHVVEDAFSAFVQGVGVERCWNLISFADNLSVSGEGPSRNQVWVLSVLKDSARVAQPSPPTLGFFQRTILPVARACDKLASSSTSECQFYRSVVIDLWALLPCFCTNPSDIAESLPSLLTTFSRAVTDERYPELQPIICDSITTLADSFNKDANGEGAATMSAASEKILPVLFKLVTASGNATTNAKPNQMQGPRSVEASMNGQRIRHVVIAISSAAKFAPSGFLDNLFKKLMHRLLEEAQSESYDSERVCTLLCLAQGLVSSGALDKENISFLYRALKPLIRNHETGARAQKRAYKVLAEICIHHHSFVAEPEKLAEIVPLLTSSIITSQVSARQMRLKCLGLIVNGLDDTENELTQELLKVSAEVFLCLKDPNGKTRDLAYDLILALASRAGAIEVLKVSLAALGAETSHMRSAAVTAMSRLVYEYAWDDEQLLSELPALLSTVLVLTSENSREVLKSVIGFIRVCVSAIPAENLRPLLPELLGCLLKYEKTKDRFRAKIKIILKKLVKRYGYDELLPYVPSSEMRLLTHMRKLEERQRRKKTLARTSENARSHESFDAMLDSDEEDSTDGRTLVSGATTKVSRHERLLDMSTVQSKTRSGSRTARSALSKKSNPKVGIRLSSEVDGEVVDMLSRKVARKVQFAEDQAPDSDSDDELIEFNDDGKLVVRDDADGLAAESIDLLGGQSSLMNRPNKRHRTDDSSRSRNSRSTARRSRDLGAAFKSKKAGGDVKKKTQRFEPYAFVPLDGRSYSKKNRKVAVEEMATVVRQGGNKRKR